MGLFKKDDGTKEEAIEWPDINELLWVRLPCCETAIHPSRVEGVDNNELLIAQPSKPHIDPVPAPSPDRTFIVGWREGADSKQVRVKVASTEEDEKVPTWTLAAQGPPETVQRRRFVRAEWDREISFYLPMQTVEGMILDLSEGGLRCAIPTTNEPRSPFFQVSFILEGEQLVLETEVAWWGQPVGDIVHVGLQFVDHATALADRLRQFAFAQQLEARKNR